MISTWFVAAVLIPGSYDPADVDPLDTMPIHRIDTSTFRLPLNINRSYAQVRDIRLFVSLDRGKTWTVQGTAKPDSGGFEFQAKTTGEHWFTVQLRLENGSFEPGDLGGLKPLVKVQVGNAEESTVRNKASLLKEETEKLDDRLTEIELGLIRKEMKRLSERSELSIETAEQIDRVRQRLVQVRSRFQAPNYMPIPPQVVIPAPGVVPRELN